MKLKLIGVIATLVLAAGILVPSTASANRIPHINGTHPIIFVHGGSGSGGQFESQAMRFESNGYPHEYISVLEYDSQSLFNFATQQVNMPLLEQVWSNLDQLIAATEAETGADQVDILGHSLGTMVMQGYINSSAERAAKLAHYVNIDGQQAIALPGTSVGVPVSLGVGVMVGVLETSGVSVIVGVRLMVGVWEMVGVTDGEGLGWK